jgi:hypothetical protein
VSKEKGKSKMEKGGISSQIPPAKPVACFCEPLKAVDFGTA